MTDKKWQELIIECQKVGIEHLRLLKMAEEEYKKRYGHYPSEVDDDWWIDTLHYCRGDVNLINIKKAAEMRKYR